MDDTTENTFEPGSIVALRSGGPALTVLGQTGEKVHCLFFSDEIGEFRETSLPAFALVEVEEGEEEDEEDEDEEEDEEEEEEDERPGPPARGGPRKN